MIEYSLKEFVSIIDSMIQKRDLHSIIIDYWWWVKYENVRNAGMSRHVYDSIQMNLKGTNKQF